MYNATIDGKGTMHVTEIDSMLVDECSGSVNESVMTGHTVIIDNDLSRLKAIADQTGLAFVTYNKLVF